MKLLNCYITLMFLPLCAWSHKVNIDISKLTESDTLTILEDDTCIFKSLNGRNANWNLKLWGKKGYEKYCIESADKRTDAIVYSLNVDAVNVSWPSTWHFNDPHNPTKFLHKGILEYDDGYQEKNIHLNFDILPPKPKIKNVKFLYDSFDEKDFVFYNSKFVIDIEAGHCDYLTFLLSDFNVSQQKHLIWIAYIDMRDPPDLAGTPPRYQINYDDDWYWDRKYALFSFNKYGHSVNSDTIYTCDYILDEQVRAAFLKATEVKNVLQYDAIDTDAVIALHNGTIRVSSIVREVSIYNTNGRLVKKAYGGDCFSLPKGLYIIKGITNDDKSLTKKIIL